MTTIKLHGETIDLSLLDRDALINLKNDLLETSAAIGIQLDKARSSVYVTGEYADPDWYRRADAAKKIAGTQIQRVNSELSRRREIARVESPFSEYFITAARAILREDALDMIFAYAKELQKKDKMKATAGEDE